MWINVKVITDEDILTLQKIGHFNFALTFTTFIIDI